ncbi:MAG: hypothetical protein J6C53_02685 [Clostridia bacterium]|nr:hypothetical protein [Clostridia bacterium]
MTSSVIITIIVVLGIIVAGGFLFYFMGDLLMGLANKKKDADAINQKQVKETKALAERVESLENAEEAKQDPDIAAILYDGAVVEAFDEEEEKAEEVSEEELTEETEEATETHEVEEESAEETEETAEEETAETEEVEEEEEDDTAEFIRQRRAELMERLARMQEEQEAEEEEEEESEEDSVNLEEETEETTEEETAETEEVEEEEVVEEIAPVEIPVVATTNAIDPLAGLTREELEARLASEQEKLKENEKDLRSCKKEFIPLRRVKKTLEKDENKLRRKEALVAKQKVVLYGVNNYADIDEEKAKKLAEDLDLLDGLKLSVQHCQEVMSKNEERYPLLEKIFTLLTAQNEEIKGDIKELQDALAKLDEQPTDAE